MQYKSGFFERLMCVCVCDYDREVPSSTVYVQYTRADDGLPGLMRCSSLQYQQGLVTYQGGMPVRPGRTGFYNPH